MATRLSVFGQAWTASCAWVLRSCGWLMVMVGWTIGGYAEPAATDIPRTWPQPYTVVKDDAAGRLTLSTPYYEMDHDLRRGGALARIALKHGKAPNLLLQPIATRVVTDTGVVLTDLEDVAPVVTHQQDGLNETAVVESVLSDDAGNASDFRLRTTWQYRWGYVKIRREFSAPAGSRVRELCPLVSALAPSLAHYGYRPGITEEEKAPPFAFGSNVWGRLLPDDPTQSALQTPFIPRSMIFMNPGVEGLEWFVSSDLAQWDLQVTGHRGEGRCLFERQANPDQLAWSIAAFSNAERAAELPVPCVFDFYLAVPLRDGRAHRPWLHTSFNRNRGAWVSTEEVRRWAEQGIQTAHCHNDGDYYGDGLFWRDGAYPPYPDMDRFDKVLTDCRQAGIRTATYFSNKELHPSTPEFQAHGEEWGRKDRAGNLQHNFYQADREFGAQMCLRSGWLDYLKLSIDRVLTNHPLDGVYYDWNVALLCSNPLHEHPQDRTLPAVGHWDMDEMLDLMEWTRRRVGRQGLVIVHNTTVPMYALENFADYVVATEWGYQKWTDRAPDLRDLPLETALAGAVPRGVISYGVLDANAPRRLHQLFASEALLNGMAPWPASEAALALNRLLQPVGQIESFRFADWRNAAVTLSDPRCAAALYSREGEAYLLLANLEGEAREVNCSVRPDLLPCPLARLTQATRLGHVAASSGTTVVSDRAMLDAEALADPGVTLTLPGDGVVLLHIQ